MLINFLYFKGKFVCGHSISNVTIVVCLNSSFCVDTSDTVIMLSDDGERRVVATFTQLLGNRKYIATLNINYTGGLVQRSQPVEISELNC